LNSFKLHKSTAEALFFDNASAVFVRLRLNETAPLGLIEIVVLYL